MDKTVQLLINGVAVDSVKTDSNGVFTFNDVLIENNGDTIKVVITPNDYYLDSESKEVTVSVRFKTNLTVDEYGEEYALLGDSIIVSGKLTTEEGTGISGEAVDIYVNGALNGTVSDSQLVDGIFSYEFSVDDVGIYSVSAKFEGDETYKTNDTSNVVDIVVNSATNLVIDEYLSEYASLGGDITITGTLTDKQGNPVTDKTVNLYINEVANPTPITVTTDTENRNFTYTFTPHTIGEYTIRAEFNTNGYYLTSQTEEETIITVKTLTFITLDEITTATKLGENTKITGKLTDYNNEGIPTETINIYLNGTKIGQTTTSNEEGKEGTFEYTLTPTELNHIGTYTINASYEANEYYLETETSNNVEVTVIGETALLLDSITSPVNLGDEIVIRGKLTDVDMNGLTGQNITLNVNGEAIDTSIETSSDESQEGTFSYPYVPENVGELTINASFDANGYYLATTSDDVIVEVYSKTNLTLDNIGAVIVDTPISITGKLTDYNGNGIVGNVNIVIDETVDTQTTSADGTFSYPVTFNDAGEHTITVSYAGEGYYFANTTSRTVTVFDKTLSKLEYTVINDIEGKVAIEFYVLDENGEEIDGAVLTLSEDVTGTVKNGRNYKNSELTEGTYIINVKYPGTEIYTPIDENITLVVKKDPEKIIDELNDTINELNNTINEQNETIENLTKNNTELNNKIEELENNTTQQQQTINTLNETINNQTQQ